MDKHREQPFIMGNKVITVYFVQPSFSPAQLGVKHGTKDSQPPTQTSRRLNPPTSSIFVTKFAKPMLESDIRRAFRAFGNIESVNLSAQTNPKLRIQLTYSTDYYEDRPSRTMAFVRFTSVEEATSAIEAWQAGALQHLGPHLRMDYELDPTQHNNAPFHTLRLSGFTGGRPVLEALAREFKEPVWRVSERTCPALPP